MTAINMDTEVVSTSVDPVANTVSYTVERDGQRWTVKIPLKELNALGPVSLAKKARMNFVGRKLQAAMLSPGEPAPPKPNPMWRR